MADFEETWKGWIRRFWWLRGVTAALALTALVPTFIDLSRYEFLRSFHAVIVGWNLLSEKLGEIIGKIPFIPQISGEVASTLIFFISIGLPIFIAWAKDPVLRYYLYYNKFTSILYLSAGSSLSIGITFGYYSIITETFDTVDIVVSSLTLLSCLFITMLILPGYGKGLIFVASFIIAMEILYLLKTPWLAEQINQFACEAIEVPLENCLPSG